MRPQIRELESTAELEKCVEIQSLVWGLAASETVSAEILSTCLKHKALLLGSFTEDRLTGFCFSVPSRWKGEPAHHSHMLAVLPESRDQGIGFSLKQAQFKILKNSVGWITWTFDPLESRNAGLNLKLGVSINTYLRELYGDGENCFLHQGLGTDRFVAEWPTSGRFKPGGKDPGPIDTSQNLIFETAWDPKGFYRVSGINLTHNAPLILLEIPGNIQAIKASDPHCAGDWRKMTRKAAEFYFAEGYTISSFHTFVNAQLSARRSFYILTL